MTFKSYKLVLYKPLSLYISNKMELFSYKIGVVYMNMHILKTILYALLCGPQ